MKDSIHDVLMRNVKNDEIRGILVWTLPKVVRAMTPDEDYISEPEEANMIGNEEE